MGLTIDDDETPLLKNKRVVVISSWNDSEDEVMPALGFEASIRKAMKHIGVSDVSFFNIFNSDEITATKDDAERAINKYISDLQL